MGLLFLSALHLTAVLLGDVVGRSVLEDLLEITAPPSIVPGGWKRDQSRSRSGRSSPLRGDVPVSPLHQRADADRRVGRPDAVRGDRSAGDGRRVRAKLGSVCTCSRGARVDLAGTGRVRRAAIVLAIGVASLSAAERTARAKPLDPANADALVVQARSEGLDGFCKTPQTPLSPRTRELCPLAGDVTGCDGLVAACKEKPLSEKDLPDFNPGRVGSILSAHRERRSSGCSSRRLVGVIVWFIVSAILRARRDKQAAERPAPRPARAVPDPAIRGAGDGRPTPSCSCARRTSTRGAAIWIALPALYLAASLRALDRRGAIRIARHRTNGEYVRSCRDAEAKPDLRAIVREVDRVHFGRERATAERIADVAARASALVARVAPSALLAIALIVLASVLLAARTVSARPGSGGTISSWRSSRRKGRPSRASEASLATMPIPAPKGRSRRSSWSTRRACRSRRRRGRISSAGWKRGEGCSSPATCARGRRASRRSPRRRRPRGSTCSSSRTTTKTTATTRSRPTRRTRRRSAAPRRSTWPGAYALATSDTHEVYVAARSFKRGVVIGFAGDDLLTNAGIARPPNAAALISILQAHAVGRKIRVARPEDGISPPSNPVSALRHAGLGLALVHAGFAALILMLAFGVRQARAVVSPPPARRAWTEHIEATGGLYSRARLAPHALAAYTRFVDGRLRERMPRGMSDPAAFLALRANVELSWAADLWRRAAAARPADMPRGRRASRRCVTSPRSTRRP